MTDIVIKLAISYALGSIMGSLLLGKLRRVDIRSMGSGNAGGTNALRTQGVAFALETMPSVDFDQAASLAFCEGQAVDLEYPDGRYQCVGPESLLLGVVEIDSDGEIAGRKVLSSARETLSR
ncbi:MAG: glycerol-3-phosphate acyltransferase [Pseudomonadota bacterium]